MKYKLIAILLILSAGTLCLGVTDSTVSRSAQAVAVSNAVSVLGCDKLEGWQEPEGGLSVSLMAMVDSTTPFLGLNNRKAYRVDFANVPVTIMKSRGPQTDTISGSRNFEVYTDSATGLVLKIVSNKPSFYEKAATGEIRYPTIAGAEADITAMNETYLGIPTDRPQKSFIEIIGAIPGDATRVDGFTAVLVNLVRGGSCLTVWVIDIFGLREPYRGTSKMEEYELNHWRALVDANTGYFIMASMGGGGRP
jgi:hypothetical protein